MKSVFESPRAKTDLKSIFRYISKNNPRAAEQVIRSVTNRFETIATHPEIGEAVGDSHPGIRRISIGSYICYYRPTARRVEILRVLHGSQDFEQQEFD